ncbi:putative nicotinamide N-methyase [Silvimonas terrae]|uniref:Putative nicotinamide N-methyase n=1 Tax=Silvimonas terrae TaxID=300266 RepID=A0A840RHH6_9NEIS|nr:type II toxin-antitoxin system Phd/YefM family antitoxin [Silvimonas terrae]MBB5191723.1 putative nicotinamide N-methyase [Silvimonas terrae]
MSKSVSRSVFKAKALAFFRQIEVTGEPVVVISPGRPSLEVRLYRSGDQHPFDQLRASLLRHASPLDAAAEGDWDLIN